MNVICGMVASTLPENYCIRDYDTKCDYCVKNGMWECLGSMYMETNKKYYIDSNGNPCESCNLVLKPADYYKQFNFQIPDLPPYVSDIMEDLVSPPSPPRMGRPRKYFYPENYVKKAPTEYNLFVQNEMANVAQQYEATQRMQAIANLWHVYNNNFKPTLSSESSLNNDQVAELWEKYKSLME